MGLGHGIIASLIIGGIAGWLAGKIVNKGEGYGLFRDIVLGIAGGFIGSWFARLLGIASAQEGSVGYIWSLIIALIGAIILVVLVRLFRQLFKREHD